MFVSIDVESSTSLLFSLLKDSEIFYSFAFCALGKMIKKKDGILVAIVVSGFALYIRIALPVLPLFMKKAKPTSMTADTAIVPNGTSGITLFRASELIVRS